MRILVLGGSGFIGTAVCQRLLRDGHSVRVFARRAAIGHPLAGNVEWVQSEFGEHTDFAAPLTGVDAVMHLVSTTVPKTSMDDPLADVHANLCGTLRLLAQAEAAGVRKLVFISSGGTVYGPARQLPIDEQHPTEPVVSYGIVKLAIEKYLHMASMTGRLSATVLRVSNPYGEGQSEHAPQGAVGAFLRRALIDQPIEIWGDGTVVRDYLYVGDVADAFARALRHPAPFALFNIGSGFGLSLNEVIRCIEQALGLALTRQHLPARAIDVPVNVLDCSLAERELGWRPAVAIEDGIRRTAAWLRGQAAG